MLFDGRGRPKNAEIEQVFEALLGNNASTAPLDILMVVDEHRVPESFVSCRPVNLLASANDQKRQALEAARFDRLFPEHRARKLKGAFACHFLRETRVSILAASYFPRIALLIARGVLTGPEAHFGHLLPRIGDKYPTIFQQDETAQRFIGTTQSLFYMNRDGRIPERYFMTVAIIMLAIALEHGLPAVELESKLEKFATFLRQSENDQQIAEAQVIAGGFNFLRQIEINGRPIEINEKQEDVFSNAVTAYDDRLRRLHFAAGRGQFAATLLLAGAYELTADLTWQPEPSADGKVGIEVVNRASERVCRFLERVEAALQGTAEENRSSAIIQQVLGLFSRHHDRHESLPLKLRLKYGWEPKYGKNRDTPIPPKLGGLSFGWAEVQMSNPQMFMLLSEIIWHLAIIGQPVELEVLAACPQIARAADALYKSINPDHEPKFTCLHEAASTKQVVRHKMVAEILGLAVNRCLVFALRPVELPGKWDSKEAIDLFWCKRPFPHDSEFPPRYTVHRLIQRYVFAQMGAPDIEYSETNQFTVSLYASQPDALPRLTHDAHARIRETIESLAGYPGAASEIEYPLSRTAADRKRRARLLRAAYGIMRSVYSVGVLSRLDARPTGDVGDASDVGHFEEHRRLMRWVLKAAVELGEGSNAAPPFYSEEIVWLFNECGLLSLVQGHLADAHSLFGRALEAARAIEPEPSRPLHLRICLNNAVVDIERGRPLEARRQVERVLEATDEDSVMKSLATGYLGLIEHLAGNVDTARKRYEQAVTQLIEDQQSRAASIFARHHADLLRTTHDQRKAREKIDQSLNLAQGGSHEDIRHLALLSRARLRIESEPEKSIAFYSDLEEVERYASLVGMPRLDCETAALRALFLLRQGETRLATSLAARSLSIAATNNLRIRKVNALLLLSEVCRKIGQPEQAKPLLALTTRLAKSAGYHFALTEIQNIESQLASGRADG